MGLTVNHTLRSALYPVRGRICSFQLLELRRGVPSIIIAHVPVELRRHNALEVCEMDATDYHQY